VNDEQVTRAPIKMKGDYLGSDELIVGRDTASTDQRGRIAEGWLRSLTWLSYDMTEKQVIAEYERKLGGMTAANRHKWNWLSDLVQSRRSIVSKKQDKPVEPRVLFDESDEWALSTANADRILSTMHRSGFNVYVPCVWHGAGTYYPTSLTMPAQGMSAGPKSRDPLQYLVERAHELKIEVHPGITVARRDDSQYPQFAPQGTPPDAYDVHDPAFVTFISNLATDLFKRYDIDGLNLDYIRAMGICESASCSTNYKILTTRDLLSDIQARGKDSEARASLVHWQDDAVTAIVRNIRRARDRYRPAALLSIDGNVTLDDNDRPLQGRNELGWLRSGLIDVVFDMDYEANLDIDKLDQIMKSTKPGSVIPIFANFDRRLGIAVSRPGWVVDDLVTLRRQRWHGSGVAFYIQKMLNGDQQHALADAAFSRPAVAWQRSEHAVVRESKAASAWSQ